MLLELAVDALALNRTLVDSEVRRRIPRVRFLVVAAQFRSRAREQADFDTSQELRTEARSGAGSRQFSPGSLQFLL